MSGPGGTKTVRCTAALIVGVLLTGGLGACAFESDRDPQSTLAGQSQRSAPTVPADDTGVLGAETRNYAELRQRLAMTTGSVLLDDSGPADGPAVGFNKVATVKADGPHTVTATCVGIPHLQIYLSQTQTVQLQKGYVSAQLTRPDPTGAWTGAVAGIKITVQ